MLWGLLLVELCQRCPICDCHCWDWVELHQALFSIYNIHYSLHNFFTDPFLSVHSDF